MCPYQVLGSNACKANKRNSFRLLMEEELVAVSGGELEYHCESNGDSGFCSAWDTDTGYQVTLTYQFEPAGDTIFTEIVSVEGNNYVASQSGYTELSAAFVGFGVALMALPLGGATAATVGSIARFAFKRLTSTGPNQVPVSRNNN